MSGFLKTNWQLILVLGIFAFALAVRMNSLPVGLWWDEARYASFGRELLSHPFDYSTKYIEGGGPVALYSPLLPYTLMFSQLILGAGELLSVQIVNVLLGALSCVVIYFLGKWLFGWKVGIIASALLSVSPVWLFYNGRVLLETPLVFFMLLAMALFWRGFEMDKMKSTIASGASTALAYLSRVSGGLLLPIQALYLLITRGVRAVLKDRKVWLFLIAAILVASPWFLRNLMLCGNIECGALQSGISVATGTHAGAAFDFFLLQWLAQIPNLLSIWVGAFFVLGFTLACLAVWQKRRGAKAEIFLLVWWLVLMGFLTQQFGSAGQDLRHIIFLVPPSILMASYSIAAIAGWFKKWSYAPLAVILIILAPLMWASGVQSLAVAGGARSSFGGLDMAGRQLGEIITEKYNQSLDDVKILAGSPNQINYFLGCCANISHYWWLWDKENQSITDFFKEHGWDYLVIDVYEPTQPPEIFELVNQMPYLRWETTIFHKNVPVAAIYSVRKSTLAMAVG